MKRHFKRHRLIFLIAIGVGLAMLNHLIARWRLTSLKSPALMVAVQNGYHKPICDALSKINQGKQRNGTTFASYQVLGAEKIGPSKVRTYLIAGLQDMVRDGDSIKLGTGSIVPARVDLENGQVLDCDIADGLGMHFAPSVRRIFPDILVEQALKPPSEYLVKIQSDQEKQALTQLGGKKVLWPSYP